MTAARSRHLPSSSNETGDAQTECQIARRPDVCCWHLADMTTTLGDIRFRG